MLAADFAPGFPLQHAAKDAALAAHAAHHHRVDLPLTEALLRSWQRAIELGHGADDVASAITVPAITSDSKVPVIRRCTRDADGRPARSHHIGGTGMR